MIFFYWAMTSGKCFFFGAAALLIFTLIQREGGLCHFMRNEA